VDGSLDGLRRIKLLTHTVTLVVIGSQDKRAAGKAALTSSDKSLMTR
jgi:hypothetical protein